MSDDEIKEIVATRIWRKIRLGEELTDEEEEIALKMKAGLKKAIDISRARKGKIAVERVEVPTELPEGVATVAFEMETEKYAEMVETIFEGVLSGKYEFRSAVNFDNHVRTVMYERETRGKTPIEVICKDSGTAWSLQQTIDWTLHREIKVVAVRRQKNMVEVAYLRKGIPAPPPKEKLVYTFKKTDGWTLTGEPKK